MLLRDWKDINRARGARIQQQQQQRTASQSFTSVPAQYPSAPATIESPMDHLSGDMDRMHLAGQEPPPLPKTPDHGYVRQSPQMPPKELRPDPRMATPMQSSAPYPQGLPSQPSRPLPSGPAGRPAFPSEPMQQSIPSRAAPSGYDADPFAYQVSCNSSTTIHRITMHITASSSAGTAYPFKAIPT